MVEIISCIVVIGMMVIPVVGIIMERKDFNNGICPECSKQLKFFDTDSQGGRGYCCHHCGYYTWVSYGIVDKQKNKKGCE